MKELNWSVCEECFGHGKKNRKISKKTKLRFQTLYDSYLKKPSENIKPIAPIPSLYSCTFCNGAGIVASSTSTKPDYKQFPHIAIIGLGIGGIALAVACMHRGIPFSIFERDQGFDTRSQGYGLTLQQASKALKALGINKLADGVVSTLHLVHNHKGTILGSWGFRKWGSAINDKKKHSNIHIARQSLRLVLLNQIDFKNTVYWNYQLINFTCNDSDKQTLNFLVDGKIKQVRTDLIVGADGIRSTVRQQLFKEKPTPLRYLGCIVILGICALKNLNALNSPLLDAATVFQTANGNERLYVMPYTKDKIMWQFSFPISEEEAKELNNKGAKSLKEETIRRITWHQPLPQIIQETEESLITGYPVYDRAVLTTELKDANQAVTLIGDAAHPMSPFKGQGANQALLDALELARSIYTKYKFNGWKEGALRTDVLNGFETEMLQRSTVKVKESAAAAQFLHSTDVLKVMNQPRKKINS